MKRVAFPESAIEGVTETTITTEMSVVIIGANGSGKTRLGSKLESDMDAKSTIRISAQKSLSIPESVSPVSLERAKASLLFGSFYMDFDQSVNHKNNSRWGGKPETFLLNDYDKLLVYLFSDNYEEVLRYKRTMEESEVRIEPPKTKLDATIEIWEHLIPHRKLLVSSGALMTKPVNQEEGEYKASEMSDGERVIFYLIGHCLSAPENGTIIVDEPELHLHKSIQRKLWDRIERERQDCLFIYLTHDLEFASTRVGSVKICLKDFDGQDFHWFPVTDVGTIPEEVYLEILGSRSPVIFIEGSTSSYDRELYTLIYPEYTIKSVGSCKKVIEATKSFNLMKGTHNLDCYGIVDRDYRPSSHIAALREDKIFCPRVAEVENLFLVEEVLRAVASQFCVAQIEDKISEIKKWVIGEFEKFKETYALEATVAHLHYCMNSFDGRAETIDILDANVATFFREIGAKDYYQQKVNEAEKLVAEKDYNEILKRFNHKGIVSQVGRFFDIKPVSYTRKVKDIIDAGSSEIVNAMKNYLPALGA